MFGGVEGAYIFTRTGLVLVCWMVCGCNVAEFWDADPLPPHTTQRMGCTVWCEQKRRNRRKPTQNPKVTPKGHPKDNFRMLQNVGNHTFIGKRPEAFERGSMCRLKRPCVNLALASPYVSRISLFGGFKHILFTQRGLVLREEAMFRGETCGKKP